MTNQPFEDAPDAVGLKRQLQGAEREVRLRRQAYPSYIATRRMSAAKAAEEIGRHGAYSLHCRHPLEVAG
jgi:hypothetical protein